MPVRVLKHQYHNDQKEIANCPVYNDRIWKFCNDGGFTTPLQNKPQAAQSLFYSYDLGSKKHPNSMPTCVQKESTVNMRTTELSVKQGIIQTEKSKQTKIRET